MEDVSQLTEFGKIFIYLIVGSLLVLFTMLIGKIIRPKQPSVIKNSTYECGEIPRGSSWVQFNNRFYVIALIFLLFDVEIVFIFPWATVFGQAQLLALDKRWGWFTLIEMFIFLGILFLGLIYVWIKGDLDWIKPHLTRPENNNSVPLSAYEHINLEAYQIKPFSVVNPLTSASSPHPTEELKAVPKKPAFRPAFKKKGNENT